MTKRIIFFLFLITFLFPALCKANLGVGVGSGKIEVKDQLKPGVIYNLPPLTVLNTGDEISNYGLSIEYHEKQSELRPKSDWFNFSPSEFKLNPGEAKVVEIKLNLPISVAPGNYFAYLEAHPVKKSNSGNVSVNIAAASKLYFTIVPANMVLGAYYKINSLWEIYRPWPQRILTLLIILLCLFVFKKFFNIKIDRKKEKSESNSQKDTEDE